MGHLLPSGHPGLLFVGFFPPLPPTDFLNPSHCLDIVGIFLFSIETSAVLLNQHLSLIITNKGYVYYKEEVNEFTLYGYSDIFKWPIIM